MIKTYILIISTMVLSLLIFNIVGNSCTKSFRNNKNNINNLIQHFTDGSSRGRWIGGIKILSNNVGDKVSKFKLKYSRDNTNWFNVNNGDEFINSSDNDGNIYFNTPVYAKKIRLLPTECVNKCTIKFDYLEHSGKDASGANLSIPIDCEVSEWSDSSCSKTCGGGTLTKTRTIVRQPQNNGLSCPSDDENIREDVPCNQQTCAPEPCEISQWSEWSSCSKTCGGGKRTKTREITKQPKYNGEACPSDLVQEEDCNTHNCPVDCVVGDWGNWSECNKFCGGGNKTRNKEIITQPAYGGTTCPPASELTESAPCGTQDCVTSDQKRYVIQSGIGTNDTCKEETDRYWGDVGNTANRNRVGFFELNVLGGAGNNINHEHNKSYYHATKLVRNGILNASGTCAEHGKVGCSVPDYGLTAQGRGILTDTSGAGSTLCKSESNHDLVKKATYFTTEECPSEWSQKLASNISFNVNKPNGEYNLCQADLSKQGAIDFFSTFEDNRNVLKYKDSCIPEENEKLVWSGDSIKLCKYEVPPEPMYLIHHGSFDTIPSDYVPWKSSNDMVWLQLIAAQFGVPGMGKNYAFPLAGDAPQGGILATVMVPRGPPPHNTRAGWGSSPRRFITKIRTKAYPCDWNARGLCPPYCCPAWVHPSYEYDGEFYGNNNERDDLKGTGSGRKGKKVDGWIYKNPSLFDKTTSQPKIDFHKIVNITPTTTFNNSGFNKWNLVKTRNQTWTGMSAARVIYNRILRFNISPLNQNTKIYLPLEFTNDGNSVKYAIGTITQNNFAGVVWDQAKIPVNEPFTITTNSKLIGLNPSFNKRFYFRLPQLESWRDYVSLIR